MVQQLITKTFRIEGMTCVNCENRIERKLKSLRGVTQAKVCYGSGKATVSFDESEINLVEIAKHVDGIGYKANVGAQKTKGKMPALQVVGVVVILCALYIALRHFGALTIFNAFPQVQAGMGYGMLVVIGLLTSLHCVAMCGGVTLSQCVAQGEGDVAGDSKVSTLRASFLYNLGRVISYTVIGAMVGSIGSVISFSGVARGLVQLAAGAFMVIMGVNMLGVFPWLRNLNPRMPRILARKLNGGKGGHRPLLVGLINGLMPCGPLQAMQLYALSTGSPLKGGLSMLLFSLGTVPLMFGLGALSSLLSKRFTGKMMSVSAALVVILGLLMLQNGMSLSGIASPFLAKPSEEARQSEVASTAQTITSKMSAWGYEPIAVQAGIPVKWTILASAEALNGCNNAIVIPAHQLEKTLQPGENVIEFTPETAGIVPFSCWMGMIRSQIIVTD